MIKLPLPEPPTCHRLNSYGGYTSNMRGVLSYSPNMDKVDNPGMIPELHNVHKLTTTHKDYLYKRSLTGKECLPNGIAVAESGYTHSPHSAMNDARAIQRANKERADSSYNTKAQVVGSCLAPASTATETGESYIPHPCSCSSENEPRPDRLLGIMESGFTRNTQPNPTDGRVLDPVYMGQLPYLGKFGPSVTHLDFTRPSYLSGKEPNLPFSRKTDKHSGFWQEKTLPACFARGTKRNLCNPGEEFTTCYRRDYPPRWCDTDFTGFTLTGSPQLTPGIKPELNLFQGGGYYITETKESYSPIERNRVQAYPNFMVVDNHPGPFPKGFACRGMPDSCDERDNFACSSSAQRRCATGSCGM